MSVTWMAFQAVSGERSMCVYVVQKEYTHAIGNTFFVHSIAVIHMVQLVCRFMFLVFITFYFPSFKCLLLSLCTYKELPPLGLFTDISTVAELGRENCSKHMSSHSFPFVSQGGPFKQVCA